jgi:hypothetical protein
LLVAAKGDDYNYDPFILGEVKKAILLYGKSLIRQVDSQKNSSEVARILTELENKIPFKAIEEFQQVKLCIKTITQGPVKALAREPEEIRRAVRLFIDGSVSGQKQIRAEKNESSEDEQLEKAIRENIIKTLKDKRVLGLWQKLARMLKIFTKEQSPEERGIDVEAMVEIFIAKAQKDLLAAIDCLIIAIQSFVEKLIQAESRALDIKKRIKEIITGGSTIFGWLVLLAIDPAWINSRDKKALVPGERIRLQFPAKTEMGVEILYAGLSNNFASFTPIREISGKQSLGSSFDDNWCQNGVYLEEGWDSAAIIAQAKQLIYKAVFCEEPAHDFATDKRKIKDDRYLNMILEIRLRKNEHRYLPIDLCESENPLSDQFILNELQDDLPNLQIVLYQSNTSETVFRVSEDKLKKRVEKIILMTEKYGVEPDEQH